MHLFITIIIYKNVIYIEIRLKKSITRTIQGDDSYNNSLINKLKINLTSNTNNKFRIYFVDILYKYFL